MQILLDECSPRKLRRYLSEHGVRSVQEMGWAGKTNGELLQLMKAHGFEVLLTVDQGLRYQQNLQAAGVAVIVLIGATNDIVDLIPLMPSTLLALASIQPGDVVEITQ